MKNSPNPSPEQNILQNSINKTKEMYLVINLDLELLYI